MFIRGFVGAERDHAGRKRDAGPSICASTAPFERARLRARAQAGWRATVGLPSCTPGPLSFGLKNFYSFLFLQKTAPELLAQIKYEKRFLDKSFLPFVLEHFLNHIPLTKVILDLRMENGKRNGNMCLKHLFEHNLRNKTWKNVNQSFLSSLRQYPSSARNLPCRSGP